MQSELSAFSNLSVREWNNESIRVALSARAFGVRELPAKSGAVNFCGDDIGPTTWLAARHQSFGGNVYASKLDHVIHESAKQRATSLRSSRAHRERFALNQLTHDRRPI